MLNDPRPVCENCAKVVRTGEYQFRYCSFACAKIGRKIKKTKSVKVAKKEYQSAYLEVNRRQIRKATARAIKQDLLKKQIEPVEPLVELFVEIRTIKREVRRQERVEE